MININFGTGTEVARSLKKTSSFKPNIRLFMAMLFLADKESPSILSNQEILSRKVAKRYLNFRLGFLRWVLS